MKKNQLRFIKILACLGFMFFCCENVLLAQSPRRKPVVKRSTSGGNKQNAEKTTGANTQTSQNGAVGVTDPKLQPDAEVAVFETDYGEIVVELYPKLAPLMVARFKQLIRDGFYNKTTFHRTSPALGIIQGGDPNSKDVDPTNDGYGKSAYPSVPAEFSGIPYSRGIVGAARASDPNSANCQFFIMLKRQPAFDNKYTIFGNVIKGLANAYVISISPVTAGTEHPEDAVVVKRVSLQPRRKIIAGN